MSRWSAPAPTAATAAAGVLAVGAVTAAVVQGVAWSQATPRLDDRTAPVREQVVEATTRSARILTTLDAADAAASVESWRSVSTGPLLAAVASNEGREYRDLVAAGGASATSRIVEVAVQSIAKDRRSAQVLVGLDISVEDDEPGAAPPVQRSRLVVDMVRTKEGWRASSLTPVGVDG